MTRQRLGFLVTLTAALLSACGSEREEPATPEPTTAAAQPEEPKLSPPRRAEFADAWSRACPDQEKVGKALCKSKGMADPDFTCDFALGDGEYRRHTAELTPAGDRWDLVNPAKACMVE